MNETPSESTINGWTFKIDHDPERPVSWVYKDIKNHSYNFATEVSIEKIIVETEENGEFKTLSLQYSDFAGLQDEELDEFKEYNPKTNIYDVNVANFAVYKGKGKLLAFKTRKDVLPAEKVKGETVHERLYFFATILFGDYGNDPPHEFTGALQAARFTPAIRFETKNKSVRTVRVHWRFHFDVDSYLDSASPLNKLVEDKKKDLWGIENYASLLRDADHFPPSVMSTVRLLRAVLALFTDLTFFKAKLDECGFDGHCRFEAAGLELELSDADSDRLDISFRDPRPVLTDATNAFKKSSVSVIDANVKALTVLSAQDYDDAAVEELATSVFDAIVGVSQPVQGFANFPMQAPNIFGQGTPLPGVSAACLRRNIKHLLVRLIIKRYLVHQGITILKQLSLLKKQVPTDLADILKHLEPDDFENVIRDIESVAHSIVQAPLIPVLGEIRVLTKLARLAEDIRRLAGKILSIATFAAAERPVLHEVIGTFVRNGEVDDTWDNLHWWGTEEIPSSPGAFHAVHSHYRWSQFNTYPSAEEELVLEVANAIAGTKQKLRNKQPQFRSLVKKFASNSLSGPLIDPAIAKQTIFCALAINGDTLDKKLREKDSYEPFDKIEAKPARIASTSRSGNKGSEIVYWLSCEAVRTGQKIFKGTFLVNGFYFAHDEEKPFSLEQAGNLFALSQGVPLQKPERNNPPLFRDPILPQP